MNFFMALLLTLLWAAPAAAAEEHAPAIGQLLFPLINFLIFVYLLKRYALPLARDYLKSRREQVIAALKESGEAKQRAEALLRDYKGRLQRLDQETRQIRDALKAEGEREKTRLLAEAEESAARINADADFLADQETKLARQELRREIARAAQASAGKLVQDNLTAADRRRMVEEFLSEVGGAR
jgi:F-type H+-transporting ATPase subunit b